MWCIPRPHPTPAHPSTPATPRQEALPTPRAPHSCKVQTLAALFETEWFKEKYTCEAPLDAPASVMQLIQDTVGYPAGPFQSEALGCSSEALGKLQEKRQGEKH